MQRHRGLAGAGAALDLRDGGGGGPDDHVLLGLDGGDDVAHRVAAGPAQGGHQRAVADRGQLLAVQRRGDLRAHQVVLDAQDAAALGADDPAAYDAAGSDRGGPVEGGGGGCAPVDDQRAVVGVQHAEAADVQGLGDLGAAVGDRAVGGFHGGVRAVRALLAVLAQEQVDPAEEEVLVLGVEPVQVGAGLEDLGVPLGEGAGRADLAAFGGVVHEELGLVDLLLQTLVDTVEMLLFGSDLALACAVRLCVVDGVRRVRGILRGHPGPLLLCVGQPSTVREPGTGRT